MGGVTGERVEAFVYLVDMPRALSDGKGGLRLAHGAHQFLEGGERAQFLGAVG
jgi:hypothetical protein